MLNISVYKSKKKYLYFIFLYSTEEMINRETRILTQELAYEQNFVLVSEAAEGMLTEDTREVTKQVMQLYVS